MKQYPDAVIREIKQFEIPLLTDFLYEAIFQPENIPKVARTVLQDPMIWAYVDRHFKRLIERKFDEILFSMTKGAVTWCAIFLLTMLDISCQRSSLAQDLQRELSELAENKDANIGIAVIIDSKDTVAVNDVGYVHLPNGRHYSIAVFIENSGYDMEQTEDLISKISEIVFRHLLPS